MTFAVPYASALQFFKSVQITKMAIWQVLQLRLPTSAFQILPDFIHEAVKTQATRQETEMSIYPPSILCMVKVSSGFEHRALRVEFGLIRNNERIKAC